MKYLIQQCINFFGYEIRKFQRVAAPVVTFDDSNKDRLLKHFFETIKAVGFTPRHIIDVGANHGTWTRETLKYFPDCHYTLLEPQYWMKDSMTDLLTNDKIKFLPIGAGSEAGSFNFTIVHRDDSCSFRYTDEEAKANGFKQIKVNVEPLNTVVRNSTFPFPDIVKVDAEGLDLEVLEGASDLFGDTEVFMVEAGVTNKLFDNSLLKLTSYMDKKGYRLFDITDLNRPFSVKTLWLVELVFVKKGGSLDSADWLNLCIA